MSAFNISLFYLQRTLLHLISPPPCFCSGATSGGCEARYHSPHHSPPLGDHNRLRQVRVLSSYTLLTLNDFDLRGDKLVCLLHIVVGSSVAILVTHERYTP